MLSADRSAIEQFLAALFCHADEGTVVALRSFTHDKDDTEPRIQGWPVIARDMAEVVQAATRAATGAANDPTPLVFCPPVATFQPTRRAREVDLANGLAISVELDAGDTKAAQSRLEQLVGPVTVAVASGGEWINPETGEVFPKLHLHWRLSEVTRSVADHRRLKHARDLAMLLVGADPSAVPLVHPLRWPGSWHRKGKPKLVTMAVVNLAAEVHLDEAIAGLEEAVEAAGLSDSATHDTGPRVPGEPQAPIERLRPAVMAIPNPDDNHWDEWVKMGLLIHRATGASDGGLELWTEWSRKSAKFTVGACQERWEHFHEHPFTRSGAGTIFYRAKVYGWQPAFTWFGSRDHGRGEGADANDDQEQSGSAKPGPNEPKSGWGRPIDFLQDPDSSITELTVKHIPDALFAFVADTSDRMGVDRAAVALSCIVACASVISDQWRVQPKRHDYTWTERPRIWGAIVGDPSILKTPVISACTRPIDKLDSEARRRHAEAMRIYRRLLREAKADKSGKVPDPVHPRLSRYLVEGATVEAISEVLREDDEAKQHAPAGKVLSRHDEMSEFFGNLDRYRAGGNGGGDRGAYLRLFNGGPYTIDRIVRGSFSIPNWSACFLGGIQPGPIQKIAKDSAEDGLLQRFLYVVPSQQTVGTDRAPDSDACARYAGLFPALAGLHPLRTPDGQQVENVVFHEDAHRHREAVDAMARAMALLPDTSPRLKAAFGKWPGLFARIALTFHLIEIADAKSSGSTSYCPLLIGEQCAARVAAFLLDVMLPHLLRADAVMFSTAQTNHAERIAGWILLQGLSRVTARDVVRNYRPFSPPETKMEMAAVMERLTLVNWLEPEIPTNPMKPVHAWAVNPAVHANFAGYAEREKRRRESAREALRKATEPPRGRQAPHSDGMGDV